MGAADTNPMGVVEMWDRALRAGDWEAARAALADDATYIALDDEGATCTGAEQIVGLMRSWKGTVPDVEVVEWETIGSRVLAHLKQPAWDDADVVPGPHGGGWPDPAARGPSDAGGGARRDGRHRAVEATALRHPRPLP